MEIDLYNFIKISLPVINGFKKVELRQWGKKGIILELITEIGSFGRVLTIWEEYRHGKKSVHHLSDELSDILFVLIKLIDNIKIPYSEKIEAENIISPVDSFFRLTELALILNNAISGKVIESEKKQIFLYIESMVSIVAGFAVYYGIPLEKAHYEEMKHALLWQRLFFYKDGEKKRSFICTRKIFFGISSFLHIKKMDKIEGNKIDLRK